MYEGPDEFEARLRRKPKTKVVEPITIYRDPKTGRTFAHCTPSGRDANPPKILICNGIEYQLHFRAGEKKQNEDKDE